MVHSWCAANDAGQRRQAEALGISLAEELLDNGAREFSRRFMMEKPRDEHPGHSSTTAREKRWSAVCGPWDAWPGALADRIYAWQELPALGDALARLGPDDLLFALSQHAVEFAHARLQQQGLPWPTSPRYFAIGRTTALALHTVSGQHIHYPLDREN